MDEHAPRMRLIAMHERPELGEDFYAFYDKMASSEEVPDDALFWSHSRGEVWAAFELRQRLQRDVAQRCPPVYITASNFAIYIVLYAFPLSTAQRCQTLDYFRDLTLEFEKVEVVFGQRESALLNVLFPRQAIPSAWRRLWLKIEEDVSLKVARRDSFNDATLKLVDTPYLFDFNVEGAPFEVPRSILVSVGVDIVERRFSSLLQPKGAVLFEVAYVDARNSGFEQYQWSEYTVVIKMNALAHRNVTGFRQGWSLTCMQILDNARVQFIVSGLYVDRKTAVPMWRALLTERIGTITREECAPCDCTWFVAPDKSLTEVPYFYAWTRWHHVYVEIRDVVIALLPLELPPYIILELLDFTDHLFACQSEFNKINLIVGVIASARRVVAQRRRDARD